TIVNLVTNGTFDENINGWDKWNGPEGCNTHATGTYAHQGAGALKVVNDADHSEQHLVQIHANFTKTLEAGKDYRISYWIRSEAAGSVRCSTSGADNYQGDQSTSDTWKEITWTITAIGGETGLNFDLGAKAGTYYIDDVLVVDLEEPAINLVANGTFDENTTGWDKWNGPEGCNTHATGTYAHQGAGALKVVNDADHSEQHLVQIHANFTKTLEAGKDYRISYWIRSEAAGSVRCSTSGADNYQGDQSTSDTWKEITWTITAIGGETGLNFDLGAKAGTYYIDDVLVQEIPTETRAASRMATFAFSHATLLASGPTSIEKSDAEKTEIIGAALENWIKEMVSHYKDKVNAWDVVNEPMDDGKPSALKTGIGKTDLANDVFYWQDYLGKDYAVTAFKLARQYGNPNDTLFINDYNLEQSLAKCDGLIEYVKYIESKGVKVDGIGTQMHLSIDSNKDNIARMFEKLAQTDKLIKISELDITVGTASPTVEQYAQQAEMYQYVVDMYLKYIPEAQRYGITVWTVSDNAKEHESWLPDDAPSLWNKDYQRKHAYKGFADGLAGKDVSADFTGEL
ncbi:hypothetical protein EZS27_029852, partial [termite gut metagenome]